MRLRVLPILAPALLKGGSLVFLWQTCKQVGMAGRDALPLEGVSHFGDELEQSEAGIDETIAFARFLDKGGDIIAGQVEQPMKPLRFLIGMHGDALRVFDLSLVLQKLSMTSTTMESCTLWNGYL